MTNAVTCTPRLFADDTCLVVKSPNSLSLQTAINDDLDKLYVWCCANKLTINPSKSEAVIIAPKLTKISDPHLTITCAGTPVNVASYSKYLGVLIDSKLNFKEQITVLENKISRSVGILAKLKHYFPHATLLQLYYALVHPLLLYGVMIWGATFPSYLQKLQILQNKAVRIVSNSDYYEHAPPIYIKLNILTLKDLYTHEIAKFVYNSNRTKLPTPLSDLFKKTCDISTRNTRQSTGNQYYIPRYRTNRLQKCIRYQGVKIWNSIPQDLKDLPYNKFKQRYKEHLISLY